MVNLFHQPCHSRLINFWHPNITQQVSYQRQSTMKLKTHTAIPIRHQSDCTIQPLTLEQTNLNPESTANQTHPLPHISLDCHILTVDWHISCSSMTIPMSIPYTKQTNVSLTWEQANCKECLLVSPRDKLETTTQPIHLLIGQSDANPALIPRILNGTSATGDSSEVSNRPTTKSHHVNLEPIQVANHHSVGPLPLQSIKFPRPIIQSYITYDTL